MPHPIDYSTLREPGYYRPHRPTDRAPIARKHEGPYYGAQLRRILEPEVPPSVVDRGQTWLATHPSGIGFVCGVASMVAAWGVVRFGGWFVGLPDGGRRQAVVALLIAPSVTTLCVWAWRRLR